MVALVEFEPLILKPKEALSSLLFVPSIEHSPHVAFPVALDTYSAGGISGLLVWLASGEPECSWDIGGSDLQFIRDASGLVSFTCRSKTNDAQVSGLTDVQNLVKGSNRAFLQLRHLSLSLAGR